MEERRRRLELVGGGKWERRLWRRNVLLPDISKRETTEKASSSKLRTRRKNAKINEGEEDQSFAINQKMVEEVFLQVRFLSSFFTVFPLSFVKSGPSPRFIHVQP